MTLTVSLGNDKSVIAEMKDLDSGEVGLVAEMITDPSKLDSFCAGWGAKGAAFAAAAKDDEPEFPVVRVEEGWSNNGRLYGPAFLESVAEQTNRLEPVGHLGHIENDKVATSFPDPQTTWFGATVKTEKSQQQDRKGEMVKAVYFAGYNLKNAKVREYLKAKAVRGISWFGRGEQVPVPGLGVEVKNFSLLALDWARKGGEGMPTSSVVAIASEMEGSAMSDKALSQVTPEEFKKENPNGYQLLVTEATADKDKTIAEMEAKVEEGDEAKNLLAEIRKALHIKDGDDPLTAIADAMSKLGDKAKDVLDKALDKVLTEKVPDEKKRALVRRLLPVAEMTEKVKDAKEDEAETLISEMVTDLFDKDDEIKDVVSEMAPPVLRRQDRTDNGGNQDNSYIKREVRTLA